MQYRTELYTVKSKSKCDGKVTGYNEKTTEDDIYNTEKAEYTHNCAYPACHTYVFNYSSNILTISPSIILFIFFTAQKLPHIEHVSSFSGLDEAL